MDSSSCLLSAEEIKYCLESPHIKYNFYDINNIGAGRFGSVYEAVHNIENRKYAVKFVKKVSLDFDKREVKLLASLDHPNVLRNCTSWITPFHKWNSCSEGSGEEISDSIVSVGKEISPSEIIPQSLVLSLNRKMFKIQRSFMMPVWLFNPSFATLIRISKF